MTGKAITFRLHNQENEKHLDSKPDKTEYLNDLIEKDRTGKLEDPSTIESKTKIEKLRKLIKENLQLDIKNKVALIHELKIAPEKAILIASGALELIVEDDSKEKTYDPPEEKQNNIIKKRWNNLVKEIRKKEDGWKVTCTLCDVSFLAHSTQEEAVERFKQHLEESHMEVYQR